MLRNCAVAPSGHSAVALLNEVLSLNAQEFDHVAVNRPRIVVLNEVLSLNAQESEFEFRVWRPSCSSMKS